MQCRKILWIRESEYEGECMRPKDHAPPHFDGQHWFDDDMKEHDCGSWDFDRPCRLWRGHDGECAFGARTTDLPVEAGGGLLGGRDPRAADLDPGDR